MCVSCQNCCSLQKKNNNNNKRKTLRISGWRQQKKKFSTKPKEFLTIDRFAFFFLCSQLTNQSGHIVCIFKTDRYITILYFFDKGDVGYIWVIFLSSPVNIQTGLDHNQNDKKFHENDNRIRIKNSTELIQGRKKNSFFLFLFLVIIVSFAI